MMDSYGMDNCGYCWAVAKDGVIQHHKDCKIGNLQAESDRRLALLKEVNHHILTDSQDCPICGFIGKGWKGGKIKHKEGCRLEKELADAND